MVHFRCRCYHIMMTKLLLGCVIELVNDNSQTNNCKDTNPRTNIRGDGQCGSFLHHLMNFVNRAYNHKWFSVHTVSERQQINLLQFFWLSPIVCNLLAQIQRRFASGEIVKSSNNNIGSFLGFQGKHTDSKRRIVYDSMIFFKFYL